MINGTTLIYTSAGPMEARVIATAYSAQDPIMLLSEHEGKLCWVFIEGLLTGFSSQSYWVVDGIELSLNQLKINPVQTCSVDMTIYDLHCDLTSFKYSTIRRTVNAQLNTLGHLNLMYSIITKYSKLFIGNGQHWFLVEE